MSAIILKKKRRILFFPTEFNKVKINSLVDSGAHINVISLGDAKKISASSKERHLPLSKSNTLKWNLKRSCHILDAIRDRGLHLRRKVHHEQNILTKTWIGVFMQAPRNTRYRNRNDRFPKDINYACTYRRNAEVQPEASHNQRRQQKDTIPAQSTPIIHVSKTVSNDHPKTSTVQLLLQFVECAKPNVASSLTTTRNMQVAIKIANTTDFPYTVTPNAKIDELQILKPEETKFIRPVDLAARNLLTNHNNVVTYVNSLMQVGRPEYNEKKLWFPIPEHPAKNQNIPRYNDGFPKKYGNWLNSKNSIAKKVEIPYQCSYPSSNVCSNE